MLRSILLLVLICCAPTVLRAQDVEVSTSGRISHAREIGNPAEIDSVLALWTNYLNSQPHVKYDNPYWSSKEKKSRAYFDLAGRFLYWGVTGQKSQRMWKPHVLSIEKRGAGYEVLTIHMSMDTMMPEQRVWAIQKVMANHDEGTWKLLSTSTQGLIRDTVSIANFRFYLPEGLRLDIIKAEQTITLANAITRKFELSKIDTIHFYIARDRDEMCSYIGLSYFLGSPTGFSISEDKLVFTSYGEPWYPHELAHVLFREFDSTMHPVLSEGIATLIGGATFLDTTYEHSLEDAKVRLQSGPPLSLITAIESPYYERSVDVNYATGAWLCKIVLERLGVKGLHSLLRAGKTTAALRDNLLSQLKITWSELESLWKQDFGIQGQ